MTKEHKEWVSLGFNKIQKKKYPKWVAKMKLKISKDFDVHPASIRFMNEIDPDLNQKYVHVTMYVFANPKEVERRIDW